MSRILYVVDDKRKIPLDASWWRLRLRPNEEHFVATQQLHRPHDAPTGFKPWSGHIDYFDGRNDWSFPFGWNLAVDYETEGPWLDCDRLILTSRKHYLEVLDVLPPSLSLDMSQWQPRDPYFHCA